MAKRWKKEQITYLRRYASKRRLEDLAARFKTDMATVQAKLTELGLESQDAGEVPFAAMDPTIKVFERGIQSLYRKKWKEAAKNFEEVIAGAQQPELKQRAAGFLANCREKLSSQANEPDNPYLEAVYEKNRGNLEEALAMCSAGGRQSKDQRFAYLAGSIHALNESWDEAAHFLELAFELDPKNRVIARNDDDLAEMRGLEEYAELFEQV